MKDVYVFVSLILYKKFVLYTIYISFFLIFCMDRDYRMGPDCQAIEVIHIGLRVCAAEATIKERA